MNYCMLHGPVLLKSEINSSIRISFYMASIMELSLIIEFGNRIKILMVILFIERMAEGLTTQDMKKGLKEIWEQEPLEFPDLLRLKPEHVRSNVATVPEKYGKNPAFLTEKT